MSFRIALNAGHYLGTAGKRCAKSLDPNETREWWLNDRICDKVEAMLADYEGHELLRIDDTTGSKNLELKERTDKANKWGADIYISVHHNAGAKGTKAGGIVVYTYTQVGAETTAWQTELYNSLIQKTGLRGNRSQPLGKANFHECRETKAPAILLELGFMDSAIDTPIILTEEYATQCAEAIVEVLVKRGNLAKKQAKQKIYIVQVCKYSAKEDAESMLEKVKSAGFADAFILTIERE